jgi:DNA-binding transcriptional ArsR family regulator
MNADPLSATLFALADPTRRGILARLSRSDASVKELAEPYDMSLAAVSKHIKVLEVAGLVTRSKDAQWRPCHLEAEPLRGVSHWLEDYRQFWERSLDRFADYLREVQEQEPELSTPTPTPNRNQKRTRNRKKGPSS